MGLAYIIKDQSGVHFITCTVHQWVDIFTRKEYIDIFLDSIKFCQKEKGLVVFAWVVMTNHVHLIVKSKDDNLSDIIRDFKKFTASKIIKSISDNPKESRRKWLLWLLKKEDKIWFWEAGYHAEEIKIISFFQTKLEYIHLNPVRTRFVEKEEEYNYSSCGDYYATRKGFLELGEFI